ncbi:hypothetical protein [Helicobacter cetorum]|uniref:Uncharacterized protein n=1 Tax=Helicobacter cetorum (strain ATCC BAA-429 / MIT 00-7128) TaxID=182217 RepID=I0EPD0_HELC0|nr:hypothetical protein [Helicobacter cetorum]AFI04799.1 hypothetical protein HCW_07705 [Helicobacter cetorum MIT 00-7128]
MQKLEFKEIKLEIDGVAHHYSKGCSGGASDCCTRVCTRNNESDSLDEWERYLEVDSGVVQY